MMLEDYSRKRKWNLSSKDEDSVVKQRIRLSSIDVELGVDTPLPPEWQQFLDLETGQLYYYNSATKTKTKHDPRETQKRESSRSIWNPATRRVDSYWNKYSWKSNNQSSSLWTFLLKHETASKKSAVAFDEKRRSEEGEMIATACEQCHMFVLLQRASLTCPNCKHIHSNATTLPSLALPPPRQTLKLLDNHEQP